MTWFSTPVVASMWLTPIVTAAGDRRIRQLDLVGYRI
jgi:hypothetical protein